jgi:hypothetical protein
MDLKQVSPNPKGEHQYQNREGRPASEEEFLDLGVPSATAKVLQVNTYKYVRYCQHHQCIVMERGPEIEMQQAMDSPLGTATGTLVTGEQQKRTPWEDWLLARIQRVKNKKHPHHHYSNGNPQANFSPSSHVNLQDFR